MTLPKRQQGMSIIFIVFILVVLSALASLVSQISGSQEFTSVYAQRGAQAYFAARAGMDYAVSRLTTGSGCAGVDGNITALNFSVAISCVVSGSYNEGSASNYDVYTVTVTASSGNFAAPDVSNRRIQATVKYP